MPATTAFNPLPRNGYATGPQSRSDFNAPAFGSVARSFELFPDLFKSLFGDTSPTRVGDHIWDRTSGFRAATFADTINSLSVPESLSAEQQAALDAFYDAEQNPLTDAELARTPEGERALGERGFTEYLLAQLGLGPAAGTTGYRFGAHVTENLGSSGFQPRLSTLFESPQGRTLDYQNTDDVLQYLDEFALRGPASATQVDRARGGNFRTYSTNQVAITDPQQDEYYGSVISVPPGVPAGGTTDFRNLFGIPLGGDDELLRVQNQLNLQRQQDYGPQPSDYQVQTGGGGNFDPPLSEALVSTRGKRNRQTQISSAARGRTSGRGVLPRSRGLLVDEATLSGAATLGGV